MNKLLKISFFLLVLFPCAGLLAGLFLALTLDASDYRQELVALVEARTGRDFSVHGDIRVAPSLIPTLVLEDVSLGNPDWAQRPLMLAAGRIETRIALLPLLGGELSIRRVYLRQPVVNLEVNADGVGNWRFPQPAAQPPETPAEQSTPPALNIDELVIEQARISYRGAPESPPMAFNIELLDVRAADQPSRLAVELEASHNDMPIRMHGTVGSLARLFAAEVPYPLALNLQVGAASGDLNGEIAQPGKLAGIDANLHLATASLADFNSIAGLDWPAVGPLELSATIRGAANELHIEDFAARLAESSLTGEATWRMAEQRPYLEADLHAGLLDLVPLQPEAEETERLFSRETFDLAALQAIDADIELRVDALHSRSVNMRDTNLKAALRDGQLTLTPAGQLAAGELDGTLTLDGNNDTPQVQVQLRIRQLLPEELPAFQDEPLIREGRTDIDFNGRGHGNSMAAIASSWNGGLLVSVGPGRLLNNFTNLAGSDLLFSTFQMLNPQAQADRDSELVCGVLNFAIEDGIATADNGIALQTARANVLGSGLIDLGTEAIEIRARPKAREGVGVNIAQFSDFVMIGGTLMEPRPVTDVSGALRTAGTVGAAFATGGLSLLAQGLFSRTFSSDDPCGVALGKPSASVQPDGERGTLDKAGDTVKGLFRGLFGE